MTNWLEIKLKRVKRALNRAKKERTGDALGLEGEEGRDKLR